MANGVTELTAGEIADRIIEKGTKDPKNFDALRQILDKVPKNRLARVIQILRARLGVMIAAAASLEALPIALALLFYYCAYLALAAALAASIGALKAWEAIISWLQKIGATIDKIVDTIRKCLAIDAALKTKVIDCILKAFRRFRGGVDSVLDQFDAQHAGKTDYDKGVELWNTQVKPTLQRFIRRLESEVRKCLEDLGDFFKPHLRNALARILATLEEIFEAIVDEKLRRPVPVPLAPAGLGLFPPGVSLGFPGKGGFTHDEMVDGEDGIIGADSNIDFFTIEQLRERKRLIREEMEVARQEQAAIERDLAAEKDPDTRQALEDALSLNLNRQDELRRALQKAYLECLERAEPGSDEFLRIFRHLQALQAKVLLPESIDAHESRLDQARRDFEEALDQFPGLRATALAEAFSDAPRIPARSAGRPIPTPPDGWRISLRLGDRLVEYISGGVSFTYDVEAGGWADRRPSWAD